MAVAMTTLKRAKNGDWLSRKAIPTDIRTAYSVSHEERFRRPATMPLDRAKQEMREWDADVSSRISALRASAKGEAISLTQRETHSLAGEWYSWFVASFEDEPGEAGRISAKGTYPPVIFRAADSQRANYEASSPPPSIAVIRVYKSFIGIQHKNHKCRSEKDYNRKSFPFPHLS